MERMTPNLSMTEFLFHSCTTVKGILPMLDDGDAHPSRTSFMLAR
jgi:hypothetical protein